MRHFTVTNGMDVSLLLNSKEMPLFHQNRLVVTEELHIIKFMMEFEHAGLEFNIEVMKHHITERFFVLFAAGRQIPPGEDRH